MLVLAPGFLGQYKIEPDPYEQTKQSKNQVAKLKGKSAQSEL